MKDTRDSAGHAVEERHVRIPCIDQSVVVGDNERTLGATVWSMKCSGSDKSMWTNDSDRHNSTTGTGGGQHSAVVIFAPAMGVPRRYYRSLAKHIVCTSRHRPQVAAVAFDWRGMFDSKFPHNFRTTHISLWHWGSCDLDSVFKYARDSLLSNAKDGHILLVGHSIGGQLVSMMQNARLLSGLASVASQSGYYGHWKRSLNKIDNHSPRPRSLRRPSTWIDWWWWRIVMTWFVTVPLMCAVFGKIPGMDTPQQVARQWMSAGRKPRYIWEEFAKTSRFQHPFNMPIMWYSIEGDYYAPRAAVEWIFRLYCPSPKATIEYLPSVSSIHSDPLLQENNLQESSTCATNLHPPQQRMIHIGGDDGRKIGHFGFQRASTLTQPLWEHLTAFLDRCIDGSSPFLTTEDAPHPSPLISKL